MTRKLWMTRTEPGASRSAALWRTAGYDTHVAPLLSVQAVKPDFDVPDNCALVFTSENGVIHSGLRGDDRPVYTVGDQTAKAALARGFSRVVSADGNWKDLLQIIEKEHDSIIHISGRVVRGDIVSSLAETGREARRLVVYETQPLEDWPVEPGDFDAVALYSPRASEILMSLPKRSLAHLEAFCLSPEVAAPLSGLVTRIARRPREDALLACSHRSES